MTFFGGADRWICLRNDLRGRKQRRHEAPGLRQDSVRTTVDVAENNRVQMEYTQQLQVVLLLLCAHTFMQHAHTRQDVQYR